MSCYWPFFYVVLGALVQDGLMSKEDVHEVQKKWDTYGWQGGLRRLRLICRLQCTKEHTVIARTVEILEKCRYTTEDTTVLKGGKATVYNVVHVYSTVHTVHVYRIGIYVFMHCVDVCVVGPL